MMNRRSVFRVLALLLLAAFLCGCGAKADGTEQNGAWQAGEELQDMPAAYGADAAPAPAPVPDTGDSQAKIIYTADMDLETTAFDEAVERLAALTAQCGGYYGSSSVNAGGAYRSARFTVRVPADRYRDFLAGAGESCHLVNISEYTEDVSGSYYDTAGRLETQRTKLARLRQLLAGAADMEDIVALESAISETEERIDSLTGELRHYDAQVEYSTVTVYLEEVYRLSNVEEPAQGFGGRLAAALKGGLRGFVSGVQSLAVALAYGWVWILLLAAGAAGVVFLLRRRARRRRARGKEDGPTAP